MDALFEALSGSALGVSLRDWAIVALATLAVGGLLKVLLRWSSGRLRARSEDTDRPADTRDTVAAVIDRTRTVFLLALGLGIGIGLVAAPARVAHGVWTGVLMVGLVQLGLWGNQLITSLLGRYRSRQEVAGEQVTSVSAFAFLGRLALWVLVLLMALQNLGVQITALVTGLGIGGIAVALAVQNVLGDLFASLSIILDRPFVIGDFLIAGEFLGTVEYIGLKTTRLRSLSGEQLIFSNSELLDRPLRNYKRMDERRALFTFGVTYQTSADQLEAIPEMVRAIVEDQEETRFDRAHFKEYGDSSLVFEVVYYVLIPDYNRYMDVQHAINVALYRRFEEESIEFAYPTRTLYVQGAEAGGVSGQPRTSTDGPSAETGGSGGAPEGPYESGTAG